MATKSKRGGDRLTGRKMPSNTSGLGAIGFFISRHGTRCVRVAFGEKRTSFSIEANGARNALRKAIAMRAIHGLPTPTLTAAHRALQKFDWSAEMRAFHKRVAKANLRG